MLRRRPGSLSSCQPPRFPCGHELERSRHELSSGAGEWDGAGFALVPEWRQTILYLLYNIDKNEVSLKSAEGLLCLFL